MREGGASFSQAHSHSHSHSHRSFSDDVESRQRINIKLKQARDCIVWRIIKCSLLFSLPHYFCSKTGSEALYIYTTQQAYIIFLLLCIYYVGKGRKRIVGGVVCLLIINQVKALSSPLCSYQQSLEELLAQTRTDIGRVCGQQLICCLNYIKTLLQTLRITDNSSILFLLDQRCNSTIQFTVIFNSFSIGIFPSV